jgi:hypothetical protein
MGTQYRLEKAKIAICACALHDAMNGFIASRRRRRRSAKT